VVFMPLLNPVCKVSDKTVSENVVNIHVLSLSLNTK